MKQNFRRYGAGLMITLVLTSGAKAADYSSYTNEEMVQMRSQARDMSQQEHDAFRSDMQSRKQSMSSEERSRFRQQNGMSGQGNRYGQSNRGGQGNGDGQNHRYGQGGGGGRGR